MADKMNVVLSADWERKMIDGLIAMMGERVEKAIQEAIKTNVAKQIEAATSRLTEEACRAAMEDVLKTGWTPTNEWGESQGKKVTLKDRINARIRAFMDGKADNYSNDRVRNFETVVPKMIEAEMAKVIAPELERAKAQTRSQVDALVGAKLKTILAEALGLNS